MSTNSFIGRELSSGEIRGVYCHWDGYPEHNGKILVESYKNTSQVDALLALGDLSILGEDPEKCVAYARDRGESDVDAKTYKDRGDYDLHGPSYTYLFDGERWLMSVEGDFVPVRYEVQ